jgi:Cytochrome P460
VKTKIMFLAILLLAVAAGMASIQKDVVVVQSSNEPFEQHESIKGYRAWTRVNPVPADFPSTLAQLCAPLTVKQLEMNSGDPHKDKFITVYVNELGTKAMMHEMKPHFPKGSVIVKEKLPSRESTSPELLTVMIKREQGYNPGNGDWEYMALDGDGKEVRARGRLEKCQACHQRAEYGDYVHRNYLPAEVREKLK